MMKQPELGKLLVELRGKKNMTQEELVEACNVSVRTIQRIESGEVTPRTTTIKIILEALGADIESISFDSETKSKQQLRSLETFLQIGWVAGVIYFVVGLVDAALEYQRFEDSYEVASIGFYFATKIVYLITYGLFIYGLIQLGDFFANYLLKITGFIMIGLFLIITAFDLITIFVPMSEGILIALGTGESLSYGAMGIVFGIGLIRLQDGMGQIAKAAGIFEIVAGAFFVLVVLFFVGYILLIPATILEIILLYKGYEFVKSERLKA